MIVDLYEVTIVTWCICGCTANSTPSTLFSKLKIAEPEAPPVAAAVIMLDDASIGPLKIPVIIGAVGG